MREKFVVWVVAAFLLLAVPLVSAQFSVEVVTLEDTIIPGEQARFDVQITNELEVTDRYTLSSGEYSYVLFVDGRPEVAPGETESYFVEVNPRSFVNFGTHRVPITIRSRASTDTAQVSPIIFLQNPDSVGREYTPSIELRVDAPQQVAPLENMRVVVHLRNRNARAYEGDESLLIRLSSDVFYHEYRTSLGPVGERGEKSAERVVQVDDYLPPGDHVLVAEVVVRNNTVSEQRMEFSIVPFSTIEQSVATDSSFFRTTSSFTLTNDGNVEAPAQVAYPAGLLSQLFIRSSHNFEVEEVDGQRSLVYSEPLGPQESVTVTYVENYRLLVLLILLGLASIVGYFLLRSPLVLGKEAEHSGDVDEGKSEIKVRLFLKNRSSQTLRNLRVIDRISGMADVQKDSSLGTLKPSKVVKKRGKGTLIRWDLDVLEPFEERIITYRVHTPLTLVGDVTLPGVKVKFDGSSGRERTTHSNEVVIGRLE